MIAVIEISMKNLSIPTPGFGPVDILVDGSEVLSLSPGECASAQIPSGNHVVQAVLNGGLTRKSRKLEIIADRDSTVRICASYSRLWGNIKLKRF